MSRRPNLFLIGAPKSGTTSLYEYLRDHPDVFMSEVKEPFYFAPDVKGGGLNYYRYGEDAERYADLFADAQDERYVGEASTRYIYSHDAPALVKEHSPDARLIAMVRNPIDMVQAMHNERVSQGLEPEHDFEAAMALDDERLAGRSLPPDANALGATYRPRARFGEQLRRWLQHFDRSALKVVVFEEFAAHTPRSFRHVLEFLEIDPRYVPVEFAVHNPSHRPRSGLVRYVVRSPLGRTLSRHVMPRLMGQRRTSLMVRRFKHSRLNRRPHPRPEVPRALRDQLIRELRPDVAVLSSIVGRDMGQFWFGDRRS